MGSPNVHWGPLPHRGTTCTRTQLMHWCIPSVKKVSSMYFTGGQEYHGISVQWNLGMGQSYDGTYDALSNKFNFL